MILVFIAIMCLIQLVFYYLKSKWIPKLPDYLILLTLILCNLFVFPKIFWSVLLPEDISCGLPAMAITFSFWVFGNIAVVSIHTIRVQFRKHITKTYSN